MSRRLRIALRTYPRAVRRRDGAALLDLATDLADGGSSVGREALGLARGGVACRLRPLRSPRWHPGLDRAGTVVAVLVAGVVWGTVAKAVPTIAGWPGWAWLVLAAAATALVCGVAAGRRAVAAAAALVLAAVGLATGNGLAPTVSGWFDAGLFFTGQGFGYGLPLLGWAIPLLLVVPLATVTADPERPTERHLAPVGWALVVALVTWLLPRGETTLLGVELGQAGAVGLACAAAILAMVLAGLARRGAWAGGGLWLAATASPLPLIVLADGLPGPGPWLALAAAFALLGGLAASARAATRA